MRLYPLASRLAGLAVALMPLASAAAVPTTPVRPVTDTYHGVTVTDPYRWMEDMKSAEFQDWMKAQQAHTAATLSRIPGREALLERLIALSDSGDRAFALQPAGKHLFYLKQEAGKESPRLFLQPVTGGKARMLVDPIAEAGGKAAAINFYTPSPDGRRVAVGISQGGSEDAVLRVIDVASGKWLGEQIKGAGLNENGIDWLDNARFVYNRLPGTEEDRYTRSRVMLHRIGTPDSADVAVFGFGVAPALAFDPADVPYVFAPGGSKWLMAIVLHGDAPDRSFYVVRRDQLDGAKTPWKRVISPDDKVHVARLAGNTVYAISNLGAPRGKLVALDPAAASPAARELVAESGVVLRELSADRKHLYLEALDAGYMTLQRLPLAGGKPVPLALPAGSSVKEIAADNAGEGAIVRVASWTQPATIYRVNGAGRASELTLTAPPKLDLSRLAATEVRVKSHDGVEVPLSILHQKDTPRDGARPTILHGYGAYGITLEPGFNPARMAWLERGGVFAVCHVRGGGEFGRDWHEGGRMLTKQNTVSDFIACAEYLVKAGYTQPAKLAGEGGSAGGITVGGAITQRPDLFGAAHSAVGVSDMLRMELTPNGPPNIGEFGTVKNPDQFKAMYAISPYHRIADGVRYPAVIVTTGANDPRVDAWMPGKLAARLQAATASGKPVLLRVDFESGHGIGSTRRQRAEESADVWSFLLWQFGEAGFQTAP